jgi:hypothetical protein
MGALEALSWEITVDDIHSEAQILLAGGSCDITMMGARPCMAGQV